MGYVVAHWISVYGIKVGHIGRQVALRALLGRCAHSSLKGPKYQISRKFQVPLYYPVVFESYVSYQVTGDLLLSNFILVPV